MVSRTFFISLRKCSCCYLLDLISLACCSLCELISSINVFLNEQCKDAMNLTDFVKNIHCQIQDLEYTGKAGYVAGISKMLVDNLSNLEVTKRPIHCTDVKRKSMYVKKDNEWIFLNK